MQKQGRGGQAEHRQHKLNLVRNVARAFRTRADTVSLGTGFGEM